MDRQTFIDALLARAKEAGFENCEVYLSSSESLYVGVFKGEIVRYESADSFGLGFRGLVKGRMGYASTQVLDEEAVDLLVEGALTNAALTGDRDEQLLWPGSPSYAEVDTWSDALTRVTAADAIAMARRLEALCLAQDPRIAQTDGCAVITGSGEVTILNTLGLNVTTRGNSLAGYVCPIAREGEDVGSGFASFSATDPSGADLEAVAAEAAEMALSSLEAGPVPSGACRVVLAPDAAADLLATFSGVFSAEAAQKGLSLLKGREGSLIAAPCVTLRDDPHMPGSAASSPFDGEGVATRPLDLIADGRLTTLLHDLKTARKQGLESTGHASRSYASTVGVAPSNLFFAPSELSREALLERAGDGLLITGISGLHAGANAVSGDFSLSARGFRIEKGRKGAPVKQITVAGNFFRLLEEIEAVGGDLRFGLPGGSRFGSPSLLIRSLSVAGE